MGAVCPGQDPAKRPTGALLGGDRSAKAHPERVKGLLDRGREGQIRWRMPFNRPNAIPAVKRRSPQAGITIEALWTIETISMALKMQIIETASSFSLFEVDMGEMVFQDVREVKRCTGMYGFQETGQPGTSDPEGSQVLSPRDGPQ